MSEIEHAISGGELRVWFQPLVGAHSRMCEGFEALVRWQHPERGLLPPSAFIEAVERSSLIGALTDQLMDLAFAECARWRDAGHMIPVGVNISRRLLTDADLPERVERLLKRHGLPGHAVTAEITESAVFDQPADAYELLRRFRALGLALSIDDFGTGYTSLTMLKSIAFDEVKIDSSFVTSMHTSHDDAAIIRAVTGLAHQLGCRVVAEGVEDAPTATVLAELGCDLLQGYHFSRPVPAADVDATLARLRRRPAPSDVRATSSGALAAPLPLDEETRLARLADLDLLDTEAETELDDIVHLAASICDTPVGLISLVDRDRQWFKARFGIDATETDRDSAFCAHAILHDAIFEVPDARGDERFANNPLVTGAPHIRFYAGAPLLIDDDIAIGTLCVLGPRPQTLTAEQRANLDRLARLAVERIQSRSVRHTLDQLTTALIDLIDLGDSEGLPAAAELISTTSRRILRADGAAVLLAEDGDAKFHTVGVDANAAATEVARTSTLDATSHPGLKIIGRTRQPLFIDNTERWAAAEHTSVRTVGARSILYVPITDRDQMNGVLVLWWHEHQEMIEQINLNIARLLAHKASTMIARISTFAALRHHAQTDELTGLANRRACMDFLNKLPPGSAIVIVDLDHFKRLNDSFGHRAGDRALKAFASHLRAAVRAEDLVGRWGGEEFLLVLPGGGTYAAQDALLRLRASWSTSAGPITTFSSGCALLAPGETPQDALSRADIALYQAKRRGRNRDVTRANASS